MKFWPKPFRDSKFSEADADNTETSAEAGCSQWRKRQIQIDPERWQVGKGGWAMLRFDPTEPPAPGDLERWVNESFRLLVPKKISAKLEG